MYLEDFGGGPGASPAANNAAMDALLAHFAGLQGQGEITLRGGIYEFAEAITFPSQAWNIIIRGQGAGRTILRQTDPNADGITLPHGLNFNLYLADFSLACSLTSSYSGSGRGIHQPGGTGSNDSYEITFDRLSLAGWGSDAILLEDAFTVTMRNVDVNHCGGRGIAGEGNTWLLQSCYVHNIAPDTPAYFVASGSPTLINCNGVDGNPDVPGSGADIWGRFGRAIADGDDEDAYCHVHLIGCNVEDFRKIGVELRNGTLRTSNTPFTGLGNTPDMQAISVRPNVEGGWLDIAPGLNTKEGGSWLNGHPVHLKAGSAANAPFSTVFGGVPDGTDFTFWSDTASVAMSMPAEQIRYIRYATHARVISNVLVPGIMKASGEVHTPGLLDFANDSAAGTGGIAVGQQYRTGSTVKVRAS
jgi:hypothetical protein